MRTTLRANAAKAETIGTTGCNSKPRALRHVVKSPAVRGGAACGNCSTTLAMESQSQHAGSRDKTSGIVYVLNKDGKPLMPCKSGRAAHLLRDGKAVVVRREPFTIRLVVDCGNRVQRVTLGVDAGYRHIGLSASTEKKELFSAEVELRTDIVELLSTRREQRSARRSRKTRHRPARFLNRRRGEGWLAPSVRQKVDSHLTVVAKVCGLLPIAKIVVETAPFDVQKMKNLDIEGEEYQRGEQMGFWNVREYVLFRDGHECQACHGKSKDPVLNVHHIESRKTGGNSPSNLITLCETCHGRYHKGELELKLKRGESFRDAAFMGIMRWAFFNAVKSAHLDKEVRNTYGYITKNARIRHGLPKAHRIDAYCIANNLEAERIGEWWAFRQVRRHNRQIHKMTILKGGVRKRNQAPYVIKGFRLWDKVRLNGIDCFVQGRRSSGSFLVKTFSGDTVSQGVGFRRLEFIGTRKTYLRERRTADSSPCLKAGVSSAEIR